MDPACAEARVTPRTSAILAVHLWGNACDVDGLAAVAERHKLKLVFDAAHAFGGSHKGRMIGSCGDAEVFSFHATKLLNTFEGGAVVTRDRELASRLRAMRNLGFTGLDEVVCAGTNGKMNEVSAAMGLTGLESLDDFLAINRRNHELYGRGLRDLPGIRVLPGDGGGNHHYVVLEVDRARSGIGRDDLMRVLRAENVLARRYFFPGCHRMPPYRDLQPGVGRFLPVTERLTGCVLCLPTGTGVSPEDVATICQLVGFAVAHGAELTERLSAVPNRPGSAIVTPDP
jgi:dTDP-4-amino-4,6-dideoxygalactose transaminase